MNYGLPYKGSKNTIAQQVVAALPRCDWFLDACCGGGAITQCAAMSGRFKHVVGNDRNAAVVDLLEAVLVTKGQLDFEHPRPCGHRDFAESLERIRSGAYTLWDVVNKLCASFGNDGRTYLYGRDIEDFKLAAERMLTERTLAGRREAYRQFVGMLTTGRGGVSRDSAEDFRLQRLEYIERLQRLENIEKLQQLQGLERLDVYEIDYGQFDVVYFDIPYRCDKKGYDFKFDHDRFYEFFASLPVPAFMSEYAAPFTLVAEFDKSSNMQSTGSTGKIAGLEKLYFNGTAERYAELMGAEYPETPHYRITHKGKAFFKEA